MTIGNIYIRKMTGGIYVAQYYFISPSIQMVKKLPILGVAFPQFDGEINMDPDLFTTMGWRKTYSLTFEILTVGYDISNGLPGGIYTLKEQIEFLDDTLFSMNMEDYHHLVNPNWNTTYRRVVVSEFGITQESGRLSAKGTIAFEYGRNPLG